MLCEFKIFLVQFDFLIPFQDVFAVVNDWYTFRIAQGSYCNWFDALNRPITLISEFNFLRIFVILYIEFLRSLQSNPIRFVMLSMYRTC